MNAPLSSLSARAVATVLAMFAFLFFGAGPVAAAPAAPSTAQASTAVSAATPVGVWDVTATADNVPPHKVQLTFASDGTLSASSSGGAGRGVWQSIGTPDGFAFKLTQPSGQSRSVLIKHVGTLKGAEFTSFGTSTLLDEQGNVVSTTRSSAVGVKIG